MGLFGKGNKAGDKKTLTVKSIDYTFCWCPPGEFLMGSPKTEAGRDDDEVQHLVKLTQGFWLLETEVTQQMWESVMGTTIQEQQKKESVCGPLRGVGPRYPMYYVSWEEAKAFCCRLGELSGLKIVLPTEAQWEYACRAGSTGAHGETDDLDQTIWCSDNSSHTSHEVKSKDPNAWGLYDMLGNVWEWCSDWYDKDYYTTPQNSDPAGPSEGNTKVDRGGSWIDDKRINRSGNRSWNIAEYRIGNVGFRLCLIPTDE